MLKKIKKDQNKAKISESLSSFKALPKSRKIYIQSKNFKNINVGMREIILEDKDVKSLVVYDTSGLYSDKDYSHNYEKGLKNVRSEWLKNRNGISESVKAKLKFLDHSKCNVRTFPSIPKKILKKKIND